MPEREHGRMWRGTAFAVALLLLGTMSGALAARRGRGDSVSSDDDADSPEAGTSYDARPLVLRAASGRVKRGAEKFLCHRLRVPRSQPMEVGRIRVVLPRGGHHVDLYRASTDQPDWPPRTCPFTVDSSKWQLVAPNQEPLLDWELPPGVAINLGPRQPLLIQTHFLSSGRTKPKGKALAKISLYPVDPESVETHAGTLFAEDRTVVVPPGRTTLRSRCTITGEGDAARDLTILGFTGQYHLRGIGFEVYRVNSDGSLGEILYEHHGDAVPPFQQYSEEDPLVLSAGEGIEWRCMYQNDTQRTFSYGPDTSRQELCSLFGFYYPTDTPQEAINCVHDATTSVCGDNLVDQANEACDGADDAACPGQCQPDCTCAPPESPVCGDDVVNQPTEACDGSDDAACSGQCQPDCTCAAPPSPVCGDDVVNQPTEACDGSDDDACPGRCQPDCTCAPAPPVCGDDVVNQPTETCDGSDDTACPGRCQPDCTCAPAPAVCGDDVVNQPTEACDGSDDTACPGHCQPDCTCEAAPPEGIVEADAWVSSDETTKNFGNDALLSVDASPATKQTFLRVRVSGVGTRRVTTAHLRLQVADVDDAESAEGGQLHAITGCGWDEQTLTWKTRPAIDGPVLATAGPVRRGQLVDFDVTAAIAGDGTYCFALESPSRDGADYDSRESRGERPALVLEVEP